jgi:GntR family transcriptional regulator
MPITISVDPRSGVPIYLQVTEQIKRSVALGILGSGEQLPTVKQLALDLTVNPNTVARAYRDLERDGIIETASGRGSFVRNTGAEAGHSAATDVARVTIEHAVREAKSVGLDREQTHTIAVAAINRWFPEEV